MAVEIWWTDLADKKFDKIIEYLEHEWGERVTSAFVGKVFDFLDILLEFPEIGTIENGEMGIRGFTVFRQVLLFYKVDEGNIIILGFFDKRQSETKRRF